METTYSTGNQTADRLGKLEITGNIIPSSWYHTICRETGKPYLNAIVILSDIVYWYRPVEVRDEGSGRIVGYKKRFKADLLQRSYQQIADQFGISKRDATNAIVALEKLGVVNRVFRTITLNGQTVPNVLFLALDVEVLEKLTFPERSPEETTGKGTEHDESLRSSMSGGGKTASDTFYERCHLFRGDVSPIPGRGLTDTGDILPSYGLEGLTETGETNTEITYKDNRRDQPIQSYQDVRKEFERQIEYGLLIQERYDKAELDELVGIATEVLTSRAKIIRVNREDREAETVKEHYRRLRMFHIRYVLNSLKETRTRARNIRALMVTALYNAADTMENYYTNLYRSHEADCQEDSPVNCLMLESPHNEPKQKGRQP